MTYPELIKSEIRAGRSSIYAILQSQRTLMPSDVRLVIRRLLYRGEIVRIGKWRYAVVERR